ncbi:MAG: threonine synthase [Nitrospirae bacterium RIFCSPLOW2_12_42_9]|nr:MAG: threonine synthase [Nitrospirae bacterium RIFCSPLOWO2_02_42_7]OGW57437.1 MAG: threonine synthase [Nitrospirae bacterium RIFCSPLOW2_12_42_9]
MHWRGVIEQYREYMSVTDQTPVITLNEGNTPFIACRNLSKAINNKIRLYLKFEGANPTGSFKDRGMTMAISKAVEAGAEAVICASTGNTSASAAAYGARAGIKVFVLIPEGKIAVGKLAQAMIHKANVIQVEGNFDEALTIVKSIASDYPITIVNSINPYRLEGQKSAAFEVCDQLGGNPDYHFLPVGNAGNITAYWMGYSEYYKKGKISSLPKMMGFQAAGAAPIVYGRVIENPTTIATAIRIGNPASWKMAVNAATESRGEINMVTDEEIIEAYKLVAATEGIFCEAASAASIAGVIKKNKEGLFNEGDTVVCTLTGHGLKDTEMAINFSKRPVTVKADKTEVLKVLGY